MTGRVGPIQRRSTITPGDARAIWGSSSSGNRVADVEPPLYKFLDFPLLLPAPFATLIQTLKLL